jgi:hypothetical protein
MPEFDRAVIEHRLRNRCYPLSLCVWWIEEIKSDIKACLTEIGRLNLELGRVSVVSITQSLEAEKAEQRGYRRGLEEAAKVCEEEQRHQERPILFAADAAWQNACRNCTNRIRALMDTPQETEEREER